APFPTLRNLSPPTPSARVLTRRARPRLDDVAPRRLQALVQLDLPEPAGEGEAGPEVAHVRLHLLAPRDAHHQLGVGATLPRGVHRRGEGAAEAGVHVGDPEAEVRVAEHLDGTKSLHKQRLAYPPAEVDQLLVVHHRALDRLAAARLDHRARDGVQAAAVEVAQKVDRE